MSLVRTSSRNSFCSCCLVGSDFIRHYSTPFGIPADNEISETYVHYIPCFGGASRSPDTSQPFQRLVPFNWGGELLVIYLGMLASFLVAGFWYPVLAHRRHGFLDRLQRVPAQ